MPEVLLSGHHANIAGWRRVQSLRITERRRPDLYERVELTRQDRKLLEKFPGGKPRRRQRANRKRTQCGSPEKGGRMRHDRNHRQCRRRGGGRRSGALPEARAAERVQDAAMQAGGLGVAMISLGGIFEQMLTAGPDGLLTSGGGMLLVLSLVLGGMAGEVMRIEDRVVGLGQTVERRLGREGFAKGFVSASLLFCVGAMAILGSIQDGLYGRPTSFSPRRSSMAFFRS